MSCEETPDQTADEIARASIDMAEVGGYAMSFRTQVQNDFIWLLDKKVASGELTPQNAQIAFRELSAYYDAVEAATRGKSPDLSR